MATSSSSPSSTEKQVMVIAIDDSEHSTYALNWTLDHFFVPVSNPIFKLILVHAKPSATSAVGLAGPGAAEILPIVDSDLRKIAARVVDAAKQLCLTKSVQRKKGGGDEFLLFHAPRPSPSRRAWLTSVRYGKSGLRFEGLMRESCILVTDVTVEVVEGDPRNVICETVEKHHASVVVVGSHGYGAIKRAVLGSVSDYCAHHAHCSVMIVKKPKTKH